MIKIAINGFGRIGRQTFRRILEKYPDLEVVAINDLTDTKTLAHLLKYDSNYGIFNKDITFEKNYILVNGKKYKILTEQEPEKLPWRKLGVDIVLECTGLFTSSILAKKHIKAGAKKVVVSAPCKDLPGFIMGVNNNTYDSKRNNVMDMGSCTTNCLAVVAKVLNDSFKIKKGFMTTVHSYTNDQRVLDLPHDDLRRARAAAINIIPTTTGAAKTVGDVLGHLKGKMDGISLRVPIPCGSITDFTCILKKPATVEQINGAMKKAASSYLKGILEYSEAPLVSSDIIGNSHSSIFDSSLTKV